MLMEFYVRPVLCDRRRNYAEDNVPSSFDAFLLGDGEKKVTEEPDTRES